MGRERAHALVRFARTEEGALAAAIVALLVTAIVAALVLPTEPGARAFRREQGTLVAPADDAQFSDDFAAPGDPSSAIGDPGSDGTAPNPSPEPTPRTPGAPPGTPPEPPPDEGLLPDLPILPPLPPPLGARGIVPGPRGRR